MHTKFENHYSFFLIYKIYLFIYGCVVSSWLRAGFLQWRRAGATLRCGAQASHYGGFSCCRARALGMRASVVAARGLSSSDTWALECRLSSCVTGAQLLCGMWDLPGPGLKIHVPCIGRRILNHCATRETPREPLFLSEGLLTSNVASAERPSLDHFFFQGFIFKEQFQVYSKIKRKIWRFPIYPFSPDLHSFSHYQHPSLAWYIFQS